MKNILLIHILLLCLLTSCRQTKQVVLSDDHMVTYKALIIDGENNHGIWPKTTMMIKDYLEETGLFQVDIERTANVWIGPHHDEVAGISDMKELLTRYPLADSNPIVVDEPVADPDFNPDFNNYDVVINNMGWKASNWSAETKQSFETYMADGGGLVVIHAANNSWGDWDAYNKMIGIGGWGGRNTETGPYVYYDRDGQFTKDPSHGPCGSHGPQFEFVVETRAANHPIMKGLPSKWLHTKDELYDRLRGPAEDITVLATAYSDVEKNGPPWNKEMSGTGRHEPMLMTIDYGKGRVFHTAMGHMDYSFECVGFITTLVRGTEWAASGVVTQSVPSDFPTASTTSYRPWDQ